MPHLYRLARHVGWVAKLLPHHLTPQLQPGTHLLLGGQRGCIRFGGRLKLGSNLGPSAAVPSMLNTDNSHNFKAYTVIYKFLEFYSSSKIPVTQ